MLVCLGAIDYRQKCINAQFVANALIEKQRIQLVNMHKDGCPWKKRQCDGRFASRGPCAF